MFIDTHSHLILGKLSKNIPEAITHLIENNFSHSIQIGTSIASSKESIDLARKYDILRVTIGIHPCEAQNIDETYLTEYMSTLENILLSEDRKFIVWIGEIGFDEFHLSLDTEEAEKQKKRQKIWFDAQARLAIQYDLPIVIHTRNCPEKTYTAIKNIGCKKFVIHCFSENWVFAQKITNLSPEAMVGFTGLVTYPQSIEIQKVAQKINLNRIMIETDAPYLIPQQMKGVAKYCEPVYTQYVFETLCLLRDESPEIIESILWQNSLRFFGLVDKNGVWHWWRT